MTAVRRTLLWRLVVEQTHGVPVAAEHLGAVAISATVVDGAAITVMLSAARGNDLRQRSGRFGTGGADADAR